jgi:hypothetical protein
MIRPSLSTSTRATCTPAATTAFTALVMSPCLNVHDPRGISAYFPATFEIAPFEVHKRGSHSQPERRIADLLEGKNRALRHHLPPL